MSAIEYLLPPPSQTLPIYTPRLLLRPFKWSDLAHFAKLRSTPEVMKWTSKGCIDDSIDQTREWMQNFIYLNDEERPRKNYNFAVFLRNSRDKVAAEESGEEKEGAFIGVCGLVSLDSLPVSRRPIFGYMFLPEAWGQGYGTEAVRGFQDAWWQILASGLEKANIEELGVIRAVTLDKNMSSMRILQKCGWVVDKSLPEEERIVRWVLRRP
jgi:RimJ/RimL family protein N-acetyltransferase